MFPQCVDNCISFMDSMLQFCILSRNVRELSLLTRIENAVLNPTKHLEELKKLSAKDKTEGGLPVFMYSDINVIKSGGVEMRGLKATMTQKRPDAQNPPSLERYTFLHNVNTSDLNENTEKSRLHALCVSLHMIIENSQGAIKIKGFEFANGSNPDVLLAVKLLQIFEGEVTITADIAMATYNNNEEVITSALASDSVARVIFNNILEEPVEQNCHFLYALDVLTRPDTMNLENSLKAIKANGFLLFEESTNSYNKTGRDVLTQFHLLVISEQDIGGSRVLVMARKPVYVKQRDAAVILHITESNFNWLDALKEALTKAAEIERYVYIVCQGEEQFRAVGFMNCIKNEKGGKLARMVFVDRTPMPKSPFTLKPIICLATG